MATYIRTNSPEHRVEVLTFLVGIGCHIWADRLTIPEYIRQSCWSVYPLIGVRKTDGQISSNAGHSDITTIHTEVPPSLINLANSGWKR